jgi:hypothetical protein
MERTLIKPTRAGVYFIIFKFFHRKKKSVNDMRTPILFSEYFMRIITWKLSYSNVKINIA